MQTICTERSENLRVKKEVINATMSKTHATPFLRPVVFLPSLLFCPPLESNLQYGTN
jgi:hypothetical protein